MNPLFPPYKGWTLFLDRDGVINKRLLNNYVKNPEEFIWEEGALEGLAILSEMFETIVVVTNQQGIGKRLMTEEDLKAIHRKMLEEAKEKMIRIDRIYHSSALRKSRNFFRKPSIGMGLLAKKEFPHIHFKRSVMVGDTLADMFFGKRLKMKTVLIAGSNKEARENHRLIDWCFQNLLEFAEFARNHPGHLLKNKPGNNANQED